MKTKKEILEMSKEELNAYKWNSDLENSNLKSSNCSDCSYCSNCSNCSNCSDCSSCFYCSNCSYCSSCFYCPNCSDCSNCSNCRSAKGLEYAICNIVVGEDDYNKKLAQLEVGITKIIKL